MFMLKYLGSLGGCSTPAVGTPTELSCPFLVSLGLRRLFIPFLNPQGWFPWDNVFEAKSKKVC